jgi:DNA polymerase I-like protein with 3'-5' exonuclease and polymerase domains
MPRIRRVKFNYFARRGYHEWLRDKPEVVAVDTETTGVAYFDTAFCATVGWTKGDEVKSAYFELERTGPWAGHLLRIILGETPKLAFHNAKFDLQKLILCGVLDRDTLTPDRIEDTEALAHLFNEHSKKGLKPLARNLLGLETNEEKRMARVRKRLKVKKADGYMVLPREVVIPYALKDAEFTILLHEYLVKRLPDEPKALYRDEMELTLVLLDLEANGMRVDMEYSEALHKRLNGEWLEHKFALEDILGKRVETGGKPDPEVFNPNSHPQVLELMQSRGHKIENVQFDTLIAIDDEVAQHLAEMSKLKKKDEYVTALLSEQRDGIIHPNFRQHGTKTGRTSSGKARDD